MYKIIHTYDLDGVLVDTSHRYRNKPDGTIDLAFWIANCTKKQIAKDEILPLAKQYLADCLNSEIYTVLCTSRMFHILDIEFIVGRLGCPDKLLMRPENNMEADSELKFKQLNSLFSLRQFSKIRRRFLWEDNQRNITRLAPLFQKTFYIPSHITGK